MDISNRFRIVLAIIALSFAAPCSGQWVQCNVSGIVNAFTANGNDLFVATVTGIFRSTDDGLSWQATDSGLGNTGCGALVSFGTKVLTATNSGLYQSTDDGIDWILVDTSLTKRTVVYTLGVSGMNLFAGGSNGIFHSTDNGTTWIAADSGLFGIDGVYSFAAQGPDLYLGGYGGIFLTTNNGSSWAAVDTGLTDADVNAVIYSGKTLFAGTYSGGIFRSTNNGTSWMPSDSGLTWGSSTSVYTFAVSDSDIFAGTWPSGVFLSTDNGDSWSAVNTGLTSRDVKSLFVLGTNLYAGTYGGGVWRRPLSEMVTSVHKHLRDDPSQILLHQNYPNPFNPSTVISYQLPTYARVILKVFDALGREVEALVNERQSAGSHSVVFNATNLPSGVYFYRLQAGPYAETKKLILIK